VDSEHQEQQAAGSRQQTQSAKRHAQSAGRTEEQEAGGSWQRAADAKRKAPGAERSAFPVTGSW